MNLRRHLARLEGSEVSVARAPEVDALAELRRKMAEILERESPSGPKPSAVWDPDRGSSRDLAALSDMVSAVDTEFGRFFSRVRRLCVSDRVGGQDIYSPWDMDTRLLGLLTLEPGLEGVDLSRAVFLDTETTGLGTGAGVLPFLVGLAWFVDGRLQVEQLLLAGPEQEFAMLQHLARRLASAEVLVTFNGKSFDWPLLESRFVMNRVRCARPARHLDLLHVARRIHKTRLGRCTLKDIEAGVFGFERLGDVEGWEVAARFGDYLRTGNAELLRPVIEHNYFDVVSMAALVSLYGDPRLSSTRLDALGVAKTLRRAKAYELAEQVCTLAIEDGHGSSAYLLRAEVHRAQGNADLCQLDLESAADDPRARLQLAKLYEHALRRPELALEQLERGTPEHPESAQRRRARLLRKLEKARRPGQ